MDIRDKQDRATAWEFVLIGFMFGFGGAAGVGALISLIMIVHGIHLWLIQ